MFIEYVQSILLIISAFFIIVAAVGLVTLKQNRKNVNYARVHIVGVFDMAVILAMLGIGQFLLAVIYFILVPFTSHAIGYAFFKSEDSLNNPDVEESVKKKDEEIENPFIHPKDKIQQLEQENLAGVSSADNRLSITTLDIEEE